MPESERNDTELMLDLVAGDHGALRELMVRWERPLYSFIYRYTQNEDASRDIVQETFARAYLKRLSYDPQYPVSSWIFTIAANLCKNKARWRRRHPEVSFEAMAGGDGPADPSRLPALASEAPSPVSRLEGAEDLTALRAAVLELPHDLKAAILLHHYENLSYKEIADVVGCSIRGVETRLYRARKLLRRRIEPLMERGDREEKKSVAPICDSPAQAAFP